MTSEERVRKAQAAADELVSQLKASNAQAEAKGAPRVPETEYTTLKRVLVHKLQRT